MEAAPRESLTLVMATRTLEVRGQHSGKMSRVTTLTMLSSNERRTGYRHLNITGPSCSYHLIRRSMSRLGRLVGGSVAYSTGGWPESPWRDLVQLQAYDILSLDPLENLLIPEKGKRNHEVTCLLQPGPDAGYNLMSVQHGRATLVMSTVVGRH